MQQSTNLDTTSFVMPLDMPTDKTSLIDTIEMLFSEKSCFVELNLTSNY